PGFVQTWRATANALEGIAADTTDTLLPLDEIGVADQREAGAAVYQLAAGIGKGRSRPDGSLRNQKTWRVFVLSSGEQPMAIKISEERRMRARAGQMVRLLDIPADAGRGFGVFDGPGPNGGPGQLADQIKIEATTYYGTDGPAFVRRLIDEGPDDIG